MLKRLAAAALLAFAFSAIADDAPPPVDPAAALTEAQTALGAGEVAHARRATEAAARALALKQGEMIRALLPAPLEGWSVDDGDTASLASLAVNAGLSMTRTYLDNTNSSDVRIELLVDSDMVQSMYQVYEDPAIAAAAGIKTETINGETAYVDPSGGSMIFILDKRSSITISGSATPEIRHVYAEAIDLAGIKAMK